jgi:YHS domain-containing protein
MQKLIISSLLLLLFQPLTNAQEVLRKAQFNTENSLAVSGYDIVSYYNQKKPSKGKAEFSVSFQGILYQFSNNANKETFKANPIKYEPAYGGWCAYAMGAKGEKVTVDPETYKVINGKLYLFYNQFFNNTLKDWNKDEFNLMSKANTNWKNFFH